MFAVIETLEGSVSAVHVYRDDQPVAARAKWCELVAEILRVAEEGLVNGSALDGASNLFDSAVHDGLEPDYWRGDSKIMFVGQNVFYHG